MTPQTRVHRRALVSVTRDTALCLRYLL